MQWDHFNLTHPCRKPKQSPSAQKEILTNLMPMSHLTRNHNTLKVPNNAKDYTLGEYLIIIILIF